MTCAAESATSATTAIVSVDLFIIGAFLYDMVLAKFCRLLPCAAYILFHCARRGQACLTVAAKTLLKALPSIQNRRNIIERLPKEHNAAVNISLRQAWSRPDPAKAQRLLENLAKKYDDICPGAVRLVREGMPEILTLTRLGLPDDLRRSLASMNIMESVNSVIARASRNVTRWRNASMGLRWTAAGMLMTRQGFRRVNGHIHLLKLADALDRIYEDKTGHKSGLVAAGMERDARVS